ncbi:winged helix-turn-helix transcriptional regulator [Clostridium sp. YIM B02505]|uniref:Winged helix-turn-helix transcriptional regulator n=1 Tax=Clostridium yunnanense TaxID=2800325 RepID=A0ABS1EP77_9CLOT|nr:MarR family winged helix-turn-helix transcriptional regulator [Clostridium yunnanense]MBK1811167.1 winged helix-turn-helix transcriptional regulator [Clostridium yunnanense]
MDKDIIISADAVSMFCRLQMNVKRDIPIRPSEMGVLIFTKVQDEPVTPLMISNFFKIAKPSVTAMVNTLIKKDYLIKTPSPTDGRSYTVCTTEKGKELVESTYNEYFKTMELLKTKLGSEEFHKFIELVQKANSILSEDR